jgi:hypothetical protein
MDLQQGGTRSECCLVMQPKVGRESDSPPETADGQVDEPTGMVLEEVLRV